MYVFRLCHQTGGLTNRHEQKTTDPHWKGINAQLKQQMQSGWMYIKMVDADGWNKQYNINPPKTYNHKWIQYMYSLTDKMN